MAVTLVVIIAAVIQTGDPAITADLLPLDGPLFVDPHAARQGSPPDGATLNVKANGDRGLLPAPADNPPIPSALKRLDTRLCAPHRQAQQKRQGQDMGKSPLFVGHAPMIGVTRIWVNEP